MTSIFRATNWPFRDKEEIRVRALLAQVLPDWRIRSRLEGGGRSHVFTVSQSANQTSEIGLLKVPRRDCLLGSHLDQFDRERQALLRAAQFDTNHRLPRVLSYFRASMGRAPGLIMEHLPGTPLARLLRGWKGRALRTQMARSEILAALRDGVADALYAAHRCGILHNDVSPRNILVDLRPDGSLDVWLIDFGVCLELLPEARYEPPLLGTPGFVPPGKRSCNLIDPRHDFWSLGLVLWYVATGTTYTGEGTPPLSQLRDASVRAVIEPLFGSLQQGAGSAPDAGFFSEKTGRGTQTPSHPAPTFRPFNAVNGPVSRTSVWSPPSVNSTAESKGTKSQRPVPLVLTLLATSALLGVTAWHPVFQQGGSGGSSALSHTTLKGEKQLIGIPSVAKTTLKAPEVVRKPLMGNFQRQSKASKGTSLPKPDFTVSTTPESPRRRRLLRVRPWNPPHLHALSANSGRALHSIEKRVFSPHRRAVLPSAHGMYCAMAHKNNRVESDGSHPRFCAFCGRPVH